MEGNQASPEQSSTPEGQQLKYDLMRVVDDHYQLSVEDSEQRYKRDRQKQIDVIDALPDNLEQLLRGFYLAQNLTDNPNSISVLTGEFLEIIVRSSQKEKLSPTGKILLELMHNPKRFGIKKGWKSLINPDTVYLQINEDGGIEIKEIGEVKKKRLGERGIRQLDKDGFHRSFCVLTSIFQRKEIATHPLLAQFHNIKVTISPNFKQVIYTSSDNIIKNHLRDLPENKHILNNVEIKELPFTSKEIDVMAKFLWDKI